MFWQIFSNEQSKWSVGDKNFWMKKAQFTVGFKVWVSKGQIWNFKNVLLIFSSYLPEGLKSFE